MNPSAVESLKAASACSAIIALTLLWIHFSGQTKVSRTLYNSLVIVCRLLVIIGTFFMIPCYFGGVAVNTMLVALGCIMVIVPLASTRVQPANDELGVALWLMFVIPVYAIKQFILGFPDHDEIVLIPPTYESVQNKLQHLIEAIGIVSATLKPIGKVEISGQEYAATSIDGKLLDHGTEIRVTGVRNTILEVKSIQEISDAV